MAFPRGSFKQRLLDLRASDWSGNTAHGRLSLHIRDYTEEHFRSFPDYSIRTPTAGLAYV
jgi:hypothetical protein